MAKKYEYNNQIFCEDDLSEEIDNYGGDLFDLYWELKISGDATECTHYYSTHDSGKTYDSAAELVEKEFDYLEVCND